MLMFSGVPIESGIEVERQRCNLLGASLGNFLVASIFGHATMKMAPYETAMESGLSHVGPVEHASLGTIPESSRRLDVGGIGPLFFLSENKQTEEVGR